MPLRQKGNNNIRNNAAPVSGRHSNTVGGAIAP